MSWRGAGWGRDGGWVLGLFPPSPHSQSLEHSDCDSSGDVLTPPVDWGEQREGLSGPGAGLSTHQPSSVPAEQVHQQQGVCLCEKQTPNH